MRIDIAAISLDVQNFRHDKVTSEPDAIRLLLADEKTHKVTELARDIVAQGGLDPSSLLIVREDPGQPGRYIALEGNRRITALKALMTPEHAAGLPSQTVFKSLHQPFLKLGIDAVECVVLDRATAATWIKRKHYKGMGGAGVVPWNAVATARSDASEGQFTRWMTALAYLEEHGIDAEDIRDQIASKTTTVERVLTSTYAASILGLSFGRDGVLTPENGDAVAATRLVQALLEAMSDRSFVEPLISSAAQQKEFIESFAALSVKKPPAIDGSAGAGSTNGTSFTNADSAPDRGSDNGRGTGTGATSGPSGAASGTGTAGGTRSRPLTLRKKLAKPGLRIANQPLNKFYSELKSLDVVKSPHTASAIIRVFVEKSSALFLEVMNIPPLNSTTGATWHDYGVKFKDKIGVVLKHLDPAGNDPQLRYVRDVANGNRDKLHTADHLNHAIHSHHALPSHAEIIMIWDRFHPYFTRLFEEIEKMNTQP